MSEPIVKHRDFTRSALRELAPKNILRAAINLGNHVLAQRDPATGTAIGISVEIARALGQRLGVVVEFVEFQAAGKVVGALTSDSWDIAFLAIDPARSLDIFFTAPYLLIEGAYLVRSDSQVASPDEMDRSNITVGVGAGSAYELYLSRTLKNAQLERLPTANDAFDCLARGEFDAAAGVRPIIERYAKDHGGLEVLSPSFMTIEQALAMPRGRDAGARYIAEFIEELKLSGFIKKALEQSSQYDAIVAPSSRST